MKKNDSFLKLLLILAITICITKSFAQIHAEGIPPSFLFEQENEFLNSTVNLPIDFDVAALRAEDVERKTDNLPPRIGKIIPVHFTTENSGEWTTLPNGQEIWRLSIIAQDAIAIMLTYDKFEIPAGAQLFMYNNDRTMILGAYTENDNPKRVEFATDDIGGDQITLEYVAPAHNYDSPLIITGVVYEYSDLLEIQPQEDGKISVEIRASDPCQVDVNCSEGDNWQNQKRGVVRIRINAGAYYFLCSGSLINNTAGDFAPLILSAQHCFEDVTPAQVNQSIYYFYYERVECKGSAGASQSMTGAELLVNMPLNGGSDGALLRLNSNVPDNYYAYYNGWDRRNVGATSGVSIHHPDGDYKKISTFTSTLISSYISIQGSGTSAQNAMWRVTWAPTVNGHGVTEGGSSGSSIFNQNKLIVGTLTGGSSFCTSPYQPDFYGKLWYHWDQHSNSNYHMKPYLDPINSGVEYIEGAYKTPLPTYTINVSASPADGGVVTGGGSYTHDVAVTVNATPNGDYIFSKWTKDGTTVGYTPTYVFRASQNANLVANFVKEKYTVSVSAKPTEGGTVSGGGSYDAGTNVTVKATPKTNFIFTEWTKGNTVVSKEADYTFPLTENVTLVANFELSDGINENTEINYFDIFPNPADNLLNIVRRNESKARIDIYNYIGVLVQSLEFNEKETAINIATLSSGIYFIKITDHKNSYTQRFMKE